MPLIHVICPIGTFLKSARDALAEELTEIALDCEQLPATSFVKSTLWITFDELPSENVYHGGKPGGTKVIAVEVNAFEGGLDDAAKQGLIERFTAAIRKHAGIAQDAVAPVYILFRDVQASDWGVFGRRITLDDIRTPDPAAKPI
jgi:phenylpyruvate tautomerase PptA (4-oxalocrotonate tautomerase family)